MLRHLFQKNLAGGICQVRTVFLDNVDDFEINVFLYLQPFTPDSRFRETINENVEGKVSDLIEIHQQGLALVNIIVLFQHIPDLADDNF